ncbi:MAG: sulfite exporter TauE/SafE family protein [Spirochaetaceae bacterium]|nr:sulfite exporter TauE/SafE family protein [Spirochaetaceae bacterium]
MNHLILIAIGVVAGALTGLIGASGVMLVVPAFVMLGIATSDAIGASLFIDAVASLVVAWTYYQNKNLVLRDGIWISIGAVAGAQVGSLLSPLVPEVGLSNSFSVFLLVSGFAFWFKGSHSLIKLDGRDEDAEQGDDGDPAFLVRLRAHPAASGLCLGLLVGVISGLLGAGGGIMILLILLFVMRFTLHEGIGTSTLIMAFTAASGAAGHALSSNLPMRPALLGAVGTVVGGRLAARYANRVDEKVLSKVVAVLFVALGVAMLLIERRTGA